MTNRKEAPAPLARVPPFIPYFVSPSCGSSCAEGFSSVEGLSGCFSSGWSKSGMGIGSDTMLMCLAGASMVSGTLGRNSFCSPSREAP